MGGTAALLAEKIALLRRILEQTKRQTALIAEGDMETLNQSLDERRACMDAVDSLDSRIRESEGGRLAGGEELRAEIASLLKEILVIDDANRADAGKQTGAAMDGIRQANQQRSVMAYLSTGDTGSRFVNREG